MKAYFIIYISLVFLSQTSLAKEIPQIIEIDHPETILFIGNSYLYYNDSLHNHFKRIVEEYDTDFDGSASVKSSTIGGSRLKHHDVERLIKPKAISSIEKFELIILQGGSTEPLSVKNREEFSFFSKKHIDAIKANDSKAALYMTHAYVKPHKRFKNSQIRVIEDTYTRVGNENEALVIPVGLAFELAYQENPTIQLHEPDGTHPNLLGTYLAACTVFASIYDKSPIGIKYDYSGAISQEDKIFLQKIADKTTSDYFNKILN